MFNNSVQEKDKTIIHAPNTEAPQNRTHLQSSSGDADREETCGHREGRRGGTNKESSIETYILPYVK